MQLTRPLPIQPNMPPHIPKYRVWVKRLCLNRFRSYPTSDLALANQPIVVTGPNGAGKSNLLEAVSLLAPGRGMRRAKTQDVAYRPPGQGCVANDHAWQWAVAADVATETGSVRIGIGQAGTKERRLDGRPATQTQIADCLAVTWLTPSMDGVLAASPSHRRGFLDRLVIAFDAAHAGRLTRYERAMRQRNKLLEEGTGNASWLDATEHELATTGVAICAARLALVDALNAETASPQLVFPAATLTLTGEVETWLGDMPAIDVEDWVGKYAAERRNMPSHMPGPHNTLVTTTHSATGRIAEQSSTGELKALLISVVLAHARLQAGRLTRPPILLLDDITAHLDDTHRQALFALTADLTGQVWFTATDADLFASLGDHALRLALDKSEVCRG